METEFRPYEQSAPPQEITADDRSSELKEIEKYWEVDPAKLNQSEQATLTKFIGGLSEFEKFHIESSIIEWGADTRLVIARALALAENNPEYETAILGFVGIGDDNERVAEIVMEKLSEVVAAIYNLEKVVDDYYQGSDKLTDQQLSQLRTDLVKRLFSFIVKTSNDIPRSLWDDDVEEATVQKLSQIKTETDVYTTVFRNISRQARAEGKKINFADFVNTKFEIAQTYELSSAEVTEMQKIYRANYPVPPYPAKFQEALVANLIPQDEINSHFYIVKRGDAITAFARFANNFDGQGKLESIDFGAFNLNPEYKGGLIGEEMMRQFLTKESNFKVPINATCDPRTTIAKKYIEFGFVGTGVQNYHGVPNILSIQLDLGRNKNLITKRKTQTETESLNTEAKISVKTFSKNEQIDFDLLKQGYVLTQLTEDKTSGQVKCIFEKPESVQVI